MQLQIGQDSRGDKICTADALLSAELAPQEPSLRLTSAILTSPSAMAASSDFALTSAHILTQMA